MVPVMKRVEVSFNFSNLCKYKNIVCNKLKDDFYVSSFFLCIFISIQHYFVYPTVIPTVIHIHTQYVYTNKVKPLSHVGK